MAFKRKRKVGRKKPIRKNYKMINPIGKGIINEKRMFRQNVLCEFESTASGINGLQYLQDGIPLNNPTMYLNNLNTWVQISATNSQWAFLSTVFDQYKVQAVKVTFIPYFQAVLETTLAVAAPSPPAFPPSGPVARAIYYSKDPDDITQVPGGSESIRMLNSGIVPKHYVEGKKLIITMVQPKSKRQYWLNMQNYALNPGTQGGGPTANAIQDMPNKAAGIRLVNEVNVGTTTPSTYYYGRFYISWDVIFRGANINV